MVLIWKELPCVSNKKNMRTITDDSISSNLDDQVNRYIRLYTLFDSLFSISRTPCGKIDHKKLNDLKEVISLCLIKWRNLRLSMQMIKVHGIEDHLFEQIEKFNGIDSYVKAFIEQTHQLSMLDEKRTDKLRDRKKAFVHH